jgi:hypothetical protein
MILAAFLMVQAAAPAPPADDIVVIGQRLQRDFKARVDFGKAGARCRVTKSTGDAAIDRIGCTALEVCFPQYRSRFDGTTDRAIRPDVRKVMREALNAELTSCVDAQHRTGVAALVAQRRRA